MINPNAEIIKYCPKCSGSAYVKNDRKIVCDGCGFELYFNTAAATAALIFDDDGRLMVIRRNHDPQKGLLDLPGGFADFGEDGESAIKREVREELGIDIEVTGYNKSIPNTYMYRGILYHTLDIFFSCRTGADLMSIKYNDEISEIMFRFPKDISEDEIAFDSMKNLIKSMNQDANGKLL
jgi:NADH pyrophosphatase NudC (nudix superfamily)